MCERCLGLKRKYDHKNFVQRQILLAQIHNLDNEEGRKHENSVRYLLLASTKLSKLTKPLQSQSDMAV